MLLHVLLQHAVSRMLHKHAPSCMLLHAPNGCNTQHMLPGRSSSSSWHV
jgi:hypothetical protein